MAVVDYNTGEYVNVQTGLLQRFGTDQGRPRRAGEYSTLLGGGQHMTEVVVDLVRLSALSTFGSEIADILDDEVTIPNGALIEMVKLTVLEASAGSSATLDFGLYDQDRTTAIDQDGLIIAGTTTWHTAAIGTIVEYTQGSTEHGALLGLVLTNTGLLSAQVDGAAYTAGVIKLQVYWSVPLAADLVSP
jgi:hypothetical protein